MLFLPSHARYLLAGNNGHTMTIDSETNKLSEEDIKAMLDSAEKHREQVLHVFLAHYLPLLSSFTLFRRYLLAPLTLFLGQVGGRIQQRPSNS